jgi:TetR/AcrR family transcriptional repressor of nem operon
MFAVKIPYTPKTTGPNICSPPKKKASRMSKGEKTRQRIIEEAATLFNTKGFAGSSVSDLLDAAGIKKGGLYRHFESKEEIALLAFDYAWSVARAMRNLPVEASASPKTQLLQFIHGFYNYTEALVPGGCPLLNTAIDSDDGNPALRERAQEALQDWLNRLETLLHQAIALGEFPKTLNPQTTAICLVASLEGGIMMSRLTGERLPLQSVCLFLGDWLESQSSNP